MSLEAKAKEFVDKRIFHPGLELNTLQQGVRAELAAEFAAPYEAALRSSADRLKDCINALETLRPEALGVGRNLDVQPPAIWFLRDELIERCKQALASASAVLSGGNDGQN